VRIGSHIALRIIGLVLAGAALLLVVRDAAVSSMNASARLELDVQQIERLSKLEDAARFFVITGDLILTGESTYLSSLATEQADSLSQQLAALRESDLATGAESDAASLAGSIERCRSILMDAATVAGDEALLEALTGPFDEASVELSGSLERLTTHFNEAAAAWRSEADAKRRALVVRSWLGAVTFLLILLVGWRHISVTIAQPIRALARRATAARDRGSFEAPSKGPTEVQELGTRLTELFGAQERAREDLEEQVEIRTRELQQALQARAAFLANTSHELRTPMNAILGFAALLADADSSEQDQEEFVGNIQQSAQHLLELIEDVLDLSKIDAGHMGIEAVGTAPREILDQVRRMLEGAAQEKGLRFETICTDAVPRLISTDPIRLRQILVNLVNNAVKFTESGSVTATLDWEDSVLEARVEDTGIGIAEDQLASIFESFEQVDSSDTRRYGGTGLGLAICKKLARLMGGDIEVESEVGEGSLFHVHLSAPEAEAAVRDDAPRGSAPAAPRDDEERPCVLVVDDVATNRLLARKVLERAGVEVVEARDGKQSLERFHEANEERRPFATVLMDLQMPIMDGYEATRTLRSLGYDGPIIALSGAVMREQRARALEAGCTDFLSKPIDPARLTGFVRKFVEGGQA